MIIITNYATTGFQVRNKRTNYVSIWLFLLVFLKNIMKIKCLGNHFSYRHDNLQFPLEIKKYIFWNFEKLQRFYFAWHYASIYIFQYTFQNFAQFPPIFAKVDNSSDKSLHTLSPDRKKRCLIAWSITGAAITKVIWWQNAYIMGDQRPY